MFSTQRRPQGSDSSIGICLEAPTQVISVIRLVPCNKHLVPRQPPLLITLDVVPDRSHILPCRIVSRVDLVERVVWVLLKLLANLINLLLPSQTLLILHLLESPLLERRICRLEPALGVTVQLVLVV